MDGQFQFSPIREVVLPNTQKGIKIYPNPVSSNGTLKIETTDAFEPFLVRFYNPEGKLMLKREGTGFMELNNLNTGVYFYKIETPTRLFNGKIIVGM